MSREEGGRQAPTRRSDGAQARQVALRPSPSPSPHRLFFARPNSPPAISPGALRYFVADGSLPPVPRQPAWVAGGVPCGEPGRRTGHTAAGDPVREGVMGTPQGYRASWWTFLLHQAPHITFQFESAGGDFAPEDWEYQQVSPKGDQVNMIKRRGGESILNEGSRKAEQAGWGKE